MFEGELLGGFDEICPSNISPLCICMKDITNFVQLLSAVVGLADFGQTFSAHSSQKRPDKFDEIFQAKIFDVEMLIRRLPTTHVQFQSYRQKYHRSRLIFRGTLKHY